MRERPVGWVGNITPSLLSTQARCSWSAFHTPETAIPSPTTKIVGNQSSITPRRRRRRSTHSFHCCCLQLPSYQPGHLLVTSHPREHALYSSGPCPCSFRPRLRPSLSLLLPPVLLPFDVLPSTSDGIEPRFTARRQRSPTSGTPRPTPSGRFRRSVTTAAATVSVTMIALELL